MIVPSSFQRLPTSSSCFNGVQLFGGALSQMGSALAQLTRVKFLHEAHYYVGRTVAVSEGGRRFLYITGEVKSQTVYNFLYQSSPVTSHLALMIKYTSSNFEFTTVSIKAELRDTALNSYTGTVLDVGCEFTEVDLDPSVQTISTAFTGCDLITAPTNINPEPPRVLFVPQSNRGQLLNVVITTTQALPLYVSIYDVFQAEVTP